MGKYTPEVWEKLQKLMSEKNNTQYWYWTDRADKSLYAELLVDRGNIAWATQILDWLMRETNLASYYVSTQEKIRLFTALVKYTDVTKWSLPIDIALRSNSVIADLSLSTRRPSAKLETTREKVGDSISITQWSSTPIFYEILQYGTPENIYDTEAQSRGMQVSRTYERIDESKWLDTNGVFLGATPVTDSIFSTGQLYRATIAITLDDTSRSWYHMTLEDFVPGAWRPIRGIFRTESTLTTDVPSSEYGWWRWNGWSYVEARDDRILATAEYGWWEKQSYSYYFRPQFPGTYLLPPATAYLMYRPEIHAIGKYQKITVK
jgi:uncharacterized protein YfaS (alpha-2-macroglobulin family)